MSNPSPSTADSHALRVLVADDDPIFRRFATARLQEAGCAVDACIDGEDALARLRRKPYDLVVLDYRMPGKNGLEVLAERASTFSPAAPYVVVTSMEDEFQTDDAKALGADAVLFKSKLSPRTLAQNILRSARQA